MQLRYIQYLFGIIFLFIVLITNDSEYRVPLFLLIINATFINTIWLTWAISKRKIQGQISIKKNAPKTFYTKLMVLALFLIFSLSTNSDTRYFKYLNLSFLYLYLCLIGFASILMENLNMTH